MEFISWELMGALLYVKLHVHSTILHPYRWVDQLVYVECQAVTGSESTGIVQPVHAPEHNHNHSIHDQRHRTPVQRSAYRGIIPGQLRTSISNDTAITYIRVTYLPKEKPRKDKRDCSGSS